MTHPMPDLTALLDGELPPERTEEIRRHLRECRACSAEEQRLRGALALLGAIPAPPAPSPSFAARLEARLEGERSRRAGWRAWIAAMRWRLAIPAAAALVAAALVVGISVRDGRVRERAMAEHLELLDDYEAIASLGDLESADDVLVIAQLDELQREGRL